MPFIHISNPLDAFRQRRRNRNQSKPVFDTRKSDALEKDPVTSEQALLEAIKSLNDDECALAVSELIERGARVRYY